MSNLSFGLYRNLALEAVVFTCVQFSCPRKKLISDVPFSMHYPTCTSSSLRPILYMHVTGNVELYTILYASYQGGAF